MQLLRLALLATWRVHIIALHRRTKNNQSTILVSISCFVVVLENIVMQFRKSDMSTRRTHTAAILVGLTLQSINLLTVNTNKLQT